MIGFRVRTTVCDDPVMLGTEGVVIGPTQGVRPDEEFGPCWDVDFPGNPRWAIYQNWLDVIDYNAGGPDECEGFFV